MGTDRVCGMDEFRVEVVNIAEEAECLKEAAKAAATSKDKEGEEEETEIIPSIPSNIQVNTCNHGSVPRLVSIAEQERAYVVAKIFPTMNPKVSQSSCYSVGIILLCTVTIATLPHTVCIGTNRQDNMDGTYLVSYTPACAGEYRVSVEFLGTFQVFFVIRGYL